MDMNEMKGPTQHKAPGFQIISKSGRKSVVEAIHIKPLAEALMEAKSGPSVASRTAAYVSVVIGLLSQYPNELRSEPSSKPLNKAKEILTENENLIFGKDQPTDSTWKTVKSRYLAAHRMGLEPAVERNGEIYAKPLRVIQAELENVAPDPKGDDDKLIEAVKRGIARGVSRPAVQEAMSLLGRFRDTLLRIENGEVPEGYQQVGDFEVIGVVERTK